MHYKIFNYKFLLVPFGSRNVYYTKTQLGFTDYYVFGIRVARFQGTAPWRRDD